MTAPSLPGLTLRVCPVCNRDVRSHREPVADERDEVVVYHQHSDGAGRRCEMSGQEAALRAVAFTNRRVA